MLNIISLPYDVLQHVFSGLSAPDVLHFIACSRQLYYPLVDDDHTWRGFCAPFNIKDKYVFGGRSFRIVYGRLLHRYGPLLGLWCSDYPFKGNIVEFRLLPDRWLRDGEPVICGDVWRFAMESSKPRPHSPYYVEFIQIGFTPRSEATPTTADDVRISWHIRSARDLGLPFYTSVSSPWISMDGGGEFALPSLHIIAPTTSTLELTNYFAHPIYTPEFPGGLGLQAAPWYDAARGVPRLPQEEPPPIAAPHQWPLPRTGNVRYVEGAPKPASIAFFPPARNDSPVYMPELHNPMHPLSGPYAAIRPRYYPLRAPAREGVDPAASEWTPDSLEGLWLGDYGPHGTECLFVEHDAAEATVRAWKITGDPNVPRGVCSWYGFLRNEAPWVNNGGETLRAYEGQGQIALHGYL